MKKIILISGKARHGKDTLAGFLRDALTSKGKRVLVCHYGDLVKFIAKNYLGWDGNKDEKGRQLLQQAGTNTIRAEIPDFWVGFVAKMLHFFGEQYDYVLIPDTRFPNEIDYMENAFPGKVMHIRVIRPNFVSDLTPEQLCHPSETALDEREPDLTVLNDGTLKELEAFVLNTVLSDIQSLEPIWTIPVYWTEAGKINIRARSLEDAINKARDDWEDISLPVGEYLDGSWEVSDLPVEEIRDLYNNGQRDL